MSLELGAGRLPWHPQIRSQMKMSTHDPTTAPSETLSADAIFDVAGTRRIELELPYSGAVTPLEAWRLFTASKAKLVDVRTPAEFASGHHPRALNIPVDEVDKRLAEFGDKKKPVVLYCQSGNRSGRAKQTLEAAGFTAVTNAGGYRDLP